VAAVVIGLFFFGHSAAGSKWMDRMAVTVPVGKFLNSRVITSRFARSMAILLKSGVQILNAMGDVANLIENKYIHGQFGLAVQKVKEGQELSDALAEMGIFPPLFLKMIIVGQKTGHLDEILDKSASIFDEEVDDALERITVMIEPVLIIVLSLVVGIILMSIMLPMVTIMTQIG
jgi:type IV pilus assembly protein PilC